MDTARAELFKTEHWQEIASDIIIYEVIAAVCSYFFVKGLRVGSYSFMELRGESDIWIRTLVACMIFGIQVLYFLGIYKSKWRFAGCSELSKAFAPPVITSIIHAADIPTILVSFTFLTKRMFV